MKDLLCKLRVRFFDNEAIREKWNDPIDYSTDEDAMNYIKSLHPKQIVMCSEIPLYLFRVRYEYTTNRGNRKNGEKVFVVNTPSPEYNCEKLLESWATKHNKENKHRQISNVKFLDKRAKALLYI